MIMSSDLGIPKRLQGAQSLVVLARGAHASIRRNLAEPLKVRVLHDVQPARSDECRKEVVVEGELVDVVDVAVERRRKPDVFADDLFRVLHVVPVGVLPVGEAPAAGAASSRLLREGKSNTRLESTGDKGALAVTGAARYADAGWVDVGLRPCEFEGVDDAGDTPGPGGQSAGGVGRAVEVVELALAARRAVLLGGDVVVVEEDGGNAGGNGNAGAVGAVVDDGREGPRAGGLVDGHREGDGFATRRGGDAQGAAGVAGGDGGLGREGAELVLLKESLDFGLTAGPVGAVGDLLASSEGEGVWKG